MTKLTAMLSKLGPGILFAGAAIGASHIVQSTRAGGEYGFSLLIVVILANLFKYPFFEYGQRYTAATGESIISGYARIGKPIPYLFLTLNLLTSVISAAGVTIVTAAILKFILIAIFGIGESISIPLISLFCVISIALVLIKGSYQILDKSVKYIVISLSIFSLFALIAALTNIDFSNHRIYESIEPFSGEISFGFLIALIGWMPAPVEASTWSSLWAVEKAKAEKNIIPLDRTLFDFNVGYITTTLLACIFLALGALVIFPSGEEVSNTGVGFVQQLINVYTTNLGEWSLPVISFVTLATMVSTTLTVIDAYPRAIEETVKVITQKKSRFIFSYNILVVLVGLSAFVIIWFFNNKLTDLIDFVTTVSFIAAPIFGLMNVLAMRQENISKHYRPNLINRLLSYVGVLFAFSLAIWYLFQ